MMSQQITPRHLQRLACLYVRQSTLQQVFENTESTARQYALRERAVALGWPAERIVVIDQDLGHSGASATDRVGFQRVAGTIARFYTLRAQSRVGDTYREPSSRYLFAPIRRKYVGLAFWVVCKSLEGC